MERKPISWRQSYNFFFDWQIFFQTISDAPSRLGVAMVRVWVMATVGEGRWSAGRTRFQLTPDSASGDRVEMERCTAVRCRCRCIAGVCQRRRSAAHVRRCVCPRRCRGLTEGVTARAVMLCLWSSGVPPARRQQGRVKTRHVALRSAYRVTAECRRSATMSADVGGDRARR